MWVQQMNSLPFFLLHKPTTAPPASMTPSQVLPTPACLDHLSLSLPHCLRHTRHLCVPWCVFTFSVSPRAVFSPKSFPSFVCLENSYSYDKAQLSCYVLWCSSILLRLCGSLISHVSAGSGDKRIRLQCRRPGFDPWVGKIPLRRERQPTPVFLPGELHGQKSLADYSPWGCKEPDTTERLTHT